MSTYRKAGVHRARNGRGNWIVTWGRMSLTYDTFQAAIRGAHHVFRVSGVSVRTTGLVGMQLKPISKEW